MQKMNNEKKATTPTYERIIKHSSSVLIIIFFHFSFFFLWQRYGTMTRLCLGCIISEHFKRHLTNFNFSHTELVLILMIAGNIKKVNNLLGHVR